MASEAKNRFAGAWGSAWDAQGNLIAEAVQVDAPVEIGRVDVNIVGTQDVGFKQGRNSREGTMSCQKIDANWELKVFALLSRSLKSRRDARDGKGPAFDPTFSLVLKWDDPEALGAEKWQLSGVRIWRLPLGYNAQDDGAVINEYPITWEDEQPLQAFVAQRDSSGVLQANYVVGSPGS